MTENIAPDAGRNWIGVMFDFERKRTPREIRSALLACADSNCDQCIFYERDAPKGYSPCHDWLMHEQAAEYIMELMALKNGYQHKDEVTDD